MQFKPHPQATMRVFRTFVTRYCTIWLRSHAAPRRIMSAAARPQAITYNLKACSHSAYATSAQIIRLLQAACLRNVGPS